jgi:heptosyltransferase-2
MVSSTLIIKLSALGDVLRTTSILKGLKIKYKNSSISWLTKSEAKDLLLNNDLIEKAYTIENKEELPNSFDLVINLDEEEEAAKLATDLGKEVVGVFFKDGNLTYTENTSSWFDMGLTSRFGKDKADRLKKSNKKTYQQIISKILGIEENEPTLNLGKKNLEFADNFKAKSNIKEDDLVIGVNTGSGKRWPLKSWAVDKTAKLIDELGEKLGAKIILFGGTEELSRNKTILEKTKASVIDAGCDNSLLDFAALIDLCDILVCSDSLAMNIAIASKKKVVALFGPTSAAEIELYGRGKKIVSPIDCYCCYKKSCDKKPSCMDLISVDNVFNAVRELK